MLFGLIVPCKDFLVSPLLLLVPRAVGCALIVAFPGYFHSCMLSAVCIVALWSPAVWLLTLHSVLFSRHVFLL